MLSARAQVALKIKCYVSRLETGFQTDLCVAKLLAHREILRVFLSRQLFRFSGLWPVACLSFNGECVCCPQSRGIFVFPHNQQMKRLPVSEETQLAELCVGFYEGLKPFVSGMVVAHLKGKTEKGWEEFVRDKKGPDGLVSGWFKEHDLRPFLDGYVDPQNTPKKAKGEEGESSFFVGGRLTLFLSSVLGEPNRA